VRPPAPTSAVPVRNNSDCRTERDGWRQIQTRFSTAGLGDWVRLSRRHGRLGTVEPSLPAVTVTVTPSDRDGRRHRAPSLSHGVTRSDRRTARASTLNPHPSPSAWASSARQSEPRSAAAAAWLPRTVTVTVRDGGMARVTVTVALAGPEVTSGLLGAESDRSDSLRGRMVCQHGP
jgi:hypothetical protein